MQLCAAFTDKIHPVLVRLFNFAARLSAFLDRGFNPALAQPLQLFHPVGGVLQRPIYHMPTSDFVLLETVVNGRNETLIGWRANFGPRRVWKPQPIIELTGNKVALFLRKRFRIYFNFNRARWSIDTMAEALHLVYITQYFHCLYCPLVRFLGAIVLRTASFSMFGLYNFAARPFFGRCRKYRELGGKRECFRYAITS
jgi:hypothetical protein